MRFLLKNRRAFVLLIFLACSLVGILIYSMPYAYAYMAYGDKISIFLFCCICWFNYGVCHNSLICTIRYVKDNRLCKTCHA